MAWFDKHIGEVPEEHKPGTPQGMSAIKDSPAEQPDPETNADETETDEPSVDGDSDGEELTVQFIDGRSTWKPKIVSWRTQSDGDSQFIKLEFPDGDFCYLNRDLILAISGPQADDE